MYNARYNEIMLFKQGKWIYDSTTVDFGAHIALAEILL